jgi:hypothetical protein
MSPAESSDGAPGSPSEDPSAIDVIIPDATSLDHSIQLKFQSALTISILGRYHFSLRHLHVNLWALTCPIADSLAELSNLRSLSIRIEDPTVRLSRNRQGSKHRSEETLAWARLGGSWGQLQALQIDNAKITTESLVDIIKFTPLQELWIRRCPKIGKSLWWHLKDSTRPGKLEILGVSGCSEIDEEAAEWIAEMESLKVRMPLGFYSRSIIT